MLESYESVWKVLSGNDRWTNLSTRCNDSFTPHITQEDVNWPTLVAYSVSESGEATSVELTMILQKEACLPNYDAVFLRQFGHRVNHLTATDCKCWYRSCKRRVTMRLFCREVTSVAVKGWKVFITVVYMWQN